MDIDKYREKLLRAKNELLSDSQKAGVFARQQPVQEAIEDGDKSVVNQAKDLLLSQADRDTELVHEIDAALVRMGEGNYGRCLECGKPIGEARLDAVPWTAYCTEHQEMHEAPESRPPTL